MIYTERLIEIAHRKERLIATAAQQRAVIADAFRSWQKPIDVIDRGVVATRYLKAHPLLVAVSIIVVAVLGRRSLLRWVGRGLFVWRSWHALQAWTRGLSA
jgi:hypothetical protein